MQQSQRPRANVKQKLRLDARLAQLYPAYSRTQLQAWIMAGQVTLDGKPITKPGVLVDETVLVALHAQEPQYASRAGYKLAHALDTFSINPTDWIVLDAGLSTGGFTDCLLQRGATKVYGVDVGYGQVHEKIRVDPRVVVIERTNLRTYTHAGEPLDLVTLDLSFISILKVLPVITKILKPTGTLVALIKPQFEATKGSVPSGGVIKDPAQRDTIVKSVIAGISAAGFRFQGVTQSPIAGADGNIEYLAHFFAPATP